jgi:Domain of Unknown Function (DUF1080)
MRVPRSQAASALMAVGMTAVLVAQGPKLDFERDEVGKPPTGFSFALTGQGRPGVWQVEKDDADHGNVLAQTDADTTGYRFPLALYDAFTARDVDLAVQFKAISGKGDQGAGLVWRYRDAKNYYVTRCNALEDSCTIYHVVNGNRQEFQNKNVKVATKTWHTLRVQAVADHFVVTYDGKAVLDARDATFKDAGKIGLWTKADSVIYFDDLQVKDLDQKLSRNVTLASPNGQTQTNLPRPFGHRHRSDGLVIPTAETTPPAKSSAAMNHKAA